MRTLKNEVMARMAWELSSLDSRWRPGAGNARGICAAVMLWRLSCRGRRRHLFNPVAAQGAVKVHQRAIAVTTRRAERQLGRKQAAFGVEHFEVVGVAVVVAFARELNGARQGHHLPLQRRNQLTFCLDGSQRVVDVAKG